MIQPKTQLFGAKIEEMKTAKSTLKEEFGRKRGNWFLATCHSVHYRTQGENKSKLLVVERITRNAHL